MTDLGDQAERALQNGRYREAARLYVRAVQTSDEETLAEKATRTAYEHEQLNETLIAANRWLVINPTNETAHRLAGLAALKLYRTEDASRHFTALLGSSYISPAAGFVELLPEFAAVGSAPAVVATLKRLIEQFPNVAEAHYALAQFAYQSQHYTLALEHATRARELSPYWAPAGFLLAQTQLASGSADAGLATAQTVVEAENSVGNRTEYAVLMLAADREADGVKLLKELGEAENEPAALRALAVAEFQSGSFEAAFGRFNRLLTQGKYVYEAMFYIAAIAERSNAIDQALKLYTRVVEGEFALPAQLRVARLTLAQGDLDGALNSLREFGESNPEFSMETISARAELLNEADDQSGALALLDDALNQYPDAAPLRMARAFQLVTMHKNPEALAAMQGLMEDRPEDPLVLNALGYTMIDTTKNYNDGYQFIQRAYAQMPDSGAVLDSMGWALFKLGRSQEALEFLQRAQKQIVDADVDLHLGDVLWALERRDDAKKAWLSGLQREPQSEELRQRLKRFEK